MLTPVTVTAPSPLVTLAEAKEHLEIDHDDRDNYITGLIDAASKVLDGYDGMVGGAIGLQTVEQRAKGFPVTLNYGPVIGLISVTYYDETNTLTNGVLSDFDFIPDDDGAVVFADEYPLTYQRSDAVTVEYQAGFTDVPADLKHACLFLVAHWYQNREAVTDGAAPKPLQYALEAIVGKYKAKWIAA